MAIYTKDSNGNYKQRIVNTGTSINPKYTSPVGDLQQIYPHVLDKVKPKHVWDDPTFTVGDAKFGKGQDLFPGPTNLSMAYEDLPMAKVIGKNESIEYTKWTPDKAPTSVLKKIVSKTFKTNGGPLPNWESTKTYKQNSNIGMRRAKVANIMDAHRETYTDKTRPDVKPPVRANIKLSGYGSHISTMGPNISTGRVIREGLGKVGNTVVRGAGGFAIAAGIMAAVAMPVIGGMASGGGESVPTNLQRANYGNNWKY
jgi:hypothetical protein